MVRAVTTRAMLALFVDLAVSGCAGVALWSAFPSLSWWWMTIPALAVYFSRLEGRGLGRMVLNTIVFAGCWWIPLVSWVPLATGGVLPWISLAATQIIALVVWVVIVRLSRAWMWTSCPLAQILVYSLTWAGVEQLRSHYPWTGFPWGNVAMPQVDSPLGRLAPWGGEVLVSVVTVALAVACRLVASRGRRGTSGSVPVRLRAALAIAAVFVVGATALIPLDSGEESGALRVGVIQGDVELPGALTFSEEGKVTANNARVTRELAESGEEVDLVIWGETGADRDPRESRLVTTILDSAARSVNAPILFGFANVADELRWNWLGIWNGGVGLDESTLYAKQKPVPFGEFIPLRSLISRLATQSAQVNKDMGAGSEPAIMSIVLLDGRTIPTAVGICFESAYSSVIGEGVRLGGQVIIAPSNNYHFRTSAESAQQAQLLRFRAMEFSRSAIQASTTGSSVVIRHDGTIQASTEPQTADLLVESVPLRTSMTPAATMGDIPAQTIMVMTGLWVFACLAAMVRGRVRSSSRK